MACSEVKRPDTAQAQRYSRRLLASRTRLLCHHGFYGLLLMHMKFALDPRLDTAATDGRRILFGPAFLDELSDSELDFVMMHEVLHVVLQHCIRGKGKYKEIFNVACDIVVNSTILHSAGDDLSAITLRKYGESMHRTPEGKEGYLYTAEQVYEMLLKECKRRRRDPDAGWDSHEMWQEEGDVELQEDWIKHFDDAMEVMQVMDPDGSRGLLPAFAARLWTALRRARTDWRTVLQNFVQEELHDYSFTPPDRRMQEYDFYLPAFNDTEAEIRNMLFMIDTSASMSDEAITAAFSEVVGAMEQFDGKLSGKLGFFDAGIIEPKEFSTMEELKIIRPAGGGGTSFRVVFDYVHRYMAGEKPDCIIILTDGGAPFPPEEMAEGIPVLWLITDEDITPPWGKVGYIPV